MADAFTSTGTSNFDQTAYDRLLYFPLRAQLFYDQIASVQPTRQTQPGATVIFNLATEMAAATTPLSETVDVDAVALGDSSVSVTLQEYGNAVITSAKLRAFSMIEINPYVANLIGYNAGISVDTLAMNALIAGTNVRYAGAVAGRTSLAATNIITAAGVRRARAELVGSNVMPKGGDGTLFVAYIHPDVAYDLRSETGSAAWRDPHTYSQPNQIWTGEVGAFEGFRFIETPRAPLFVNASNGAGATGTVDVYATLFVGDEALAKAYSNAEGNGPKPRTIIGPVTDKLMRFRPVSWYFVGGYTVFRQAALRRIESASSIGNNAT